jgi:thiol-disulfide isomerase/thioredoxin
MSVELEELSQFFDFAHEKCEHVEKSVITLNEDEEEYIGLGSFLMVDYLSNNIVTIKQEQNENKSKKEGEFETATEVLIIHHHHLTEQYSTVYPLFYENNEKWEFKRR